ncbi:MAG: sel1 repeat family protein [Magnetococcales bacterium]|nr:sel1 repeat family protein [Magnetococcales bacterium]
MNTGPLSCRTLLGTLGRVGAVLTVASFAVTGVAQAEETPPPPANQPAPDTSAANPEADFKAGRTAYEGNDWFASLPPLRRAAAAGHVPAMVMLGLIFNRAAENDEALIWYHKAALAGSLDGAYGLGTMLEVEASAPPPPPAKEDATKPAPPPPETVKAAAEIARGPEEALKWLSRAAEGNHPPAMFSLSNIYAQGKLGQNVDKKIALDWLKRAADKNFTPAMKELARVYAFGLLGETLNPKEAERLEQAVRATEPPPPKPAAGAKTKSGTGAK